MNSDIDFNPTKWTALSGNPEVILVIDFDGTITDQDAVDGLIARFSLSDNWKQVEARWRSGEIGSAECMTQQLLDVRASKEDLRAFLSEIKVDHAFGDLQAYCGAQHIPMLIMSDGFDLLIKGVFDRYRYSEVPVKCNQLQWREDRLVPSFPYIGESCGKCAHCKKKSIQDIKKQHPMSKIVYIGDGQSDVCALSEVNYVFAKNSLADYCDTNGLAYQMFNALSDVLDQLPAALLSVRKTNDTVVPPA